MQLVDHVFVFLFAVVYPLAGAAGFRRLMKRVSTGRATDRVRIYRNTMAGHWLLLGLALVRWWTEDRPWSGIGLSWSLDWRSAAAAVVALAVVALLVRQLRDARDADDATLARLHRDFGRLGAVVPRTPAELRWFQALSITAGIVEEILWRGWLIAYLDHFLPLGAAALLAVAAFGIAHAYQGWHYVLPVTGVGALLTALYLASGSVWIPMALHAAIDVLQGRLAFAIDRRRPRTGAVVVRTPD